VVLDRIASRLEGGERRRRDVGLRDVRMRDQENGFRLVRPRPSPRSSSWDENEKGSFWLCKSTASTESRSFFDRVDRAPGIARGKKQGIACFHGGW